MPSTSRTWWIRAGIRDRVKYPWAMGPPKGPEAARAGSTWIHWWSSVASANRLTRAWSTVNQSDQPRCWSARAWNSSGLWTVVDMALNLMPAASAEPDPLVFAALGVQKEGEEDHGEEQGEGDSEKSQDQDVDVNEYVQPGQHDAQAVSPPLLVGHAVAGHAEGQGDELDLGISAPDDDPDQPEHRR